MNSSHHLRTNPSLSHTTCTYTLNLRAATWCYLLLTPTLHTQGKVSWSCSWSASGTQHRWLHSWIKHKCHYFLHFTEFLYYTNLCISMAAAKMENRSRKSCWPWGVSPRNTLLLILLTYSALLPMTGHSHSSHTCPTAEEKSLHSYRMKEHSQLQRPVHTKQTRMSLQTFLERMWGHAHTSRNRAWWIFMVTRWSGVREAAPVSIKATKVITEKGGKKEDEHVSEMYEKYYICLYAYV